MKKVKVVKEKGEVKMNTGKAQVKKQQISYQFELLAKQIEELQKSIAELVNKISPILSSSGLIKGEGELEEEKLCDLAQVIKDKRCAIEDEVAKLNEIRNRVEL